jgi:hypothetical protein
MAVRPWIVGGILAACVLGGCGASSPKAGSSATSVTAPSNAGLSAPAAQRGVADRVLIANELAGFRPAGHHLLGISASNWVADNELPLSQRATETARLQRLGFVAAVRERLVPVSGIPAEALSIVERYASPTAARAELAAQVRLSRAAGPVTPFAVPGIPGAAGFGGSHGQSSGENVAFAKGAYYYLVGAGWLTGAPSAPSRSELILAAERLYERVAA